MTGKALSVLSVSLAVIAAAVAAIVVSINRSDAARSLAEAAAAQADAESATARSEEAQKAAETEKRRAAEATAKAKADELAAEKLAKETAELEAKSAADQKAAAQADAEAERAKADAAQAVRDTAHAEAEKAQAAVEATNAVVKIENAKAEAEMAKLAIEKLKAEKTIAEAKVLELRRIDFESEARRLLEKQIELEERERALEPEKSIADLSWAGGMEDSVIDENGNVTKQVKKAYDPEKDLSKPSETRKLLRANREVREAVSNDAQKVRSNILKSMEKLYVEALKEHRVIDADYYRKSIQSLYPDWEYKAQPKPLEIALTFDDGTTDQLEVAAPLLAKHGWKGQFNIITDRVSTPGYLTWDQIRSLAKQGHEIASHTLSHPDLKLLLEKGATNEVCRQYRESRQILEKETGRAPRFMCYPFSARNDETDALCLEEGMRPMVIERRNFGAGTKAGSLSGVGAVIDGWISEGRKRMDVLVHGVRPGGGWKPFDSEADYAAFLDEIAERERRGLVKVVTYAELVRGE